MPRHGADPDRFARPSVAGVRSGDVNEDRTPLSGEWSKPDEYAADDDNRQAKPRLGTHVAEEERSSKGNRGWRLLLRPPAIIGSAVLVGIGGLLVNEDGADLLDRVTATPAPTTTRRHYLNLGSGALR